MNNRLSILYTVRAKVHSTFIIIFISMGLLAACSETKPITPVFGTPTLIAQGESPLHVICKIQQEFRELPKPLMASKHYISGWTSRKFGAASVEHSGYYKIKLTQAGLDFIQTHSRLELVASLKPLFMDPSIGGEAAVLLAGIPAGDKSQQSSKTRNIANALDKQNYLSPDNPREWFKDPQWNHPAVWNLYGRANQTPNIEGSVTAGYHGTLEAKILEVLSQISNIPIKLFDPPIENPQLFKEDQIEAWLGTQHSPSLNAKTVDFIDKINNQLAALIFYPLVLPSANLDRNQILMMYLLDMQETYWPILYNFTIGLKSNQNLHKDFVQQLPLHMSKICSSIKDNKT